MQVSLLDNYVSQLPSSTDPPSTPPATGSAAAPSPPEQVEVIIRKNNCGHSFCVKGCAPRRRDYREAMAVVQSWPHDQVRQVTVSCDPKLYASPEEGYRASERSISDLARDIGRKLDKRGTGLRVLAYVAFLEWHRNGFPHWHVFILVSHAGRDGMIGQPLIKECWHHGEVVWEHPFNSAQHQRAMIGYAASKGYFSKDKAHQVLCPDWLLKSTLRVHRVRKSKEAEKTAQELRTEAKGPKKTWYGGNPPPPPPPGHEEALRIIKSPTIPPAPDEEHPQKQKRINSDILATCGASIQVYTANLLKQKRFETDHGMERRWVDKLLPYAEAKLLPGFEYVNHRGLIRIMSYAQWLTFYQQLPNCPEET